MARTDRNLSSPFVLESSGLLFSGENRCLNRLLRVFRPQPVQGKYVEDDEQRHAKSRYDEYKVQIGQRYPGCCEVSSEWRNVNASGCERDGEIEQAKQIPDNHERAGIGFSPHEQINYPKCQQRDDHVAITSRNRKLSRKQFHIRQLEKQVSTYPNGRGGVHPGLRERH